MQHKKAIFWIVLVTILFLIFDTTLYFTFNWVNKNRNLFYEKSVSRARIAYWLSNSYDPILGWNLPHDMRSILDSRKSKAYVIKDAYKIKVFGDSFALGAEVKHDETFEAVVEDKTGWDCLNYGVGSFGTDQAFLKYRSNDIHSQYTVLTILGENIGRVVAHYMAFYMRQWAPTKPRFIKKEDFELIENPIRKKEDAYNLLDKNFVERLKPFDYWSNYYENTLGAPKRLQWPATAVLVKNFPFFIRRIRIELEKFIRPSYELETETYKYYHLYDESGEAFQIMKFIVDSFVKLAKERNEHPIILVFPRQFSLDVMKKYDRNPYELLVDHLRSNQYDYIDYATFFSKEDYEKYYVSYNAHHSPLGNERVADELVKLINDLDGRKSKDGQRSDTRYSEASDDLIPGVN